MAKQIELAGPRRLTSSRAAFRRPAWAPDGRRLVVESVGDPGGLFLVDAKGRLEGHLGEGSQACFSPDGQRIALVRPGSDGRPEIWAREVTAGRAVRLAGGDGASWQHPAWSPDGSRLVCASDHGGPAGLFHLWLVDPGRGERQAITGDPQRSDAHPSFCPDGQAVAFDGDDRLDEGRERDVYVLALEGGATICLTDGAVATRRPCFIDRRYLIAERHAVAGTTLVVIDRDRQRLLPVGAAPDGERQPAVRLRAVADRRRPRVLVAYVRGWRRRDAVGEEAGDGALEEGLDAVWVAELEGLKVTGEAEAAASAVREALAVRDPKAAS